MNDYDKLHEKYMKLFVLIRKLLLDLPMVGCEDFHHDRVRDTHDYAETCPAQERWYALLNQLDALTMSKEI